MLTKAHRASRSLSFAALAALFALAASCKSRLEFPAPVQLLDSWVNLTANLANLDSQCGTLLLLAVRPDQDTLIAGVVLHGLYQLPAGATEWQPLGTATGSAAVDNDPYSMTFDPTRPGTFWETGIHRGSGVFFTSDGGNSFVSLLDGNGNILLSGNDLVSVDFTDPLRKTMLAGVHEAGPHAFLSQDAGMTWTDLTATLPATAGDTSFPLVLDANTFLIGSVDGTNSGIFRSTNAGATWTQVSTAPVNSHPLVASDGTIYWIGALGGVLSSSDHGVTWTAAIDPTTAVQKIPGLIELPDGRFAALGTDYLLISSDKAQTWTPIATLPFSSFGLIYSAPRKSFFIWNSVCDFSTTDDLVAANSVLALPFDYTTQ